jgi:hypothetical protein
MKEGLVPPFIGIRIKSFGEEWKLRGARTLELFVDSLLAASGGALPANFVITLPKVNIPEQPQTLVRLLELLEKRHRLQPGALRFELMIETTQAVVGPDGYCPMPALLSACEGRCVGAHLGTYDFTASCNITAAYQAMDHAMCDLAKGMMLLSFAGTGVFLSDGATNVMPVPPHRGKSLTPQQTAENRAVVHAAGCASHSPFVGRRLLSRLGFAPGAAAGAVRDLLRFFPGGARKCGRAPQELHRQGGAGHARGGRVRRRRDWPGLAQLFFARPQLRRHRSVRHRTDGADDRGGRAAIFRKNLGRSTRPPRRYLNTDVK